MRAERAWRARCLRESGPSECGRSRYRGLGKTHLQNVAIASAINLDRLVAWLDGRPRALTRTSRLAMLAPACATGFANSIPSLFAFPRTTSKSRPVCATHPVAFFFAMFHHVRHLFEQRREHHADRLCQGLQGRRYATP